MEIALDTCTDKVSLTIGEKDYFFTYFSLQDRKQSFFIIKIFKKALKDLGIKPEEIKKYYFTIGPGSFTGIRFGLSFIIGLTEGRKVKFYPINTLEAIALSSEGVSTVLLKQSQNFYYAGIYEIKKKLKEILKPWILSEEELEKIKKGKIIKLEDLKEPLSQIIFKRRNLIEEKRKSIKPLYIRNPYEIPKKL
ncbi:MAG: tRNA (adenosine(37)-N6)-threonylcarbamoyltransferase complex dimerization subunit type 1 TsaB [Thermoanaerobaculia bacterium]